MSETTMDQRPAASASSWRETRGKRVTVFAQDGSFAARRAQDELHDAERAVAALEDLLAPPHDRRGAPIDIYLIDPLADRRLDISAVIVGADHAASGDRPADDETIVRVVQPDGPLDPVARPLTRFLVMRWFGPDAASSALIVEGLAGVVAARTETGPTVAETDDWVRGQTAAHKPVSIFPSTDSTEDAADERAARQRVATSFVAYLLDAYGPTDLREYLVATDPDRRDQAAAVAYHRPLGALEEGWLASLHNRQGTGAALHSFWHHVGPLLKPYWPRQIEIFGYMLIGLAYTLILPLATKYIFDTIIPHGETHRLVDFIVILFVLYAINALIGLRRTYISNWVNQRILLGLEEQMFARMQRLPHSFYARAKVGDLMSRLSNDLNVVQDAMTLVIGTGVFMTLQAIVAGVTIVVLSPLLGIVVLFVVPLFAVGYFLLRKQLQQASFEMQRLAGEVNTFEQENLSAHAVTKAFGLEERSVSYYHARLMAALKAMLRMVVLGSLFQASLTLATTLGQLVVLGLGGYLVIAGHLSLGTLVAFIGLLGTLFQPISALSGLGQTVQKASGALERITELLDEPITITDKADATPLPALSQQIRLDHVDFGYDEGRPILHDIDLTIPAGANVAFVGPSGSGKSTTVNLLLRFWDPQQGRVLFDGRDLRDVTIASLRGQIGLVFQDTFIFDSTVRENIAIGRPDATDAEVAAAATAAQLDTFIESLPAGYDTVLGERGVRMSGGQRQRLAIARALLRDPRILILDEATSALDPGTEAEIQETLAEAARGRTTISITHRLTSVTGADRIFVLEQGRLVEEGTHAELVHAGGLYQHLFEEQTGMGAAVAARRLAVEADRLRAIPLFAGLSDDLVADVARHLVLERFVPDSDVVRQGEPGDTLYLIGNGQVDIIRSDGVSERRINSLGPGDYFGEMALLTDQPRSATVRTTTSAELFSLSRVDFTDLLQRAPAIRAAVTQTIARRRAALDAATKTPSAMAAR